MSAPFDIVRETLSECLPGFDEQVVESILATVLANQLQGPAVWLELIAPSSLGKTLVLQPLEGIDGAIVLSKLTPHTLLSGSWAPGGGDPSLLTRLGDRPFIVIKELSTLLQGDPHGRGEIFSQFREVWDGYIRKDYGNGITRKWSGKATVIMGITPAVDLYKSFHAHLGERCIKIRFAPSLDPEDLALSAWNSVGKEDDTNARLSDAFREGLAAAGEVLPQVGLSETTLKKIAALASFTAAVRAPVERDPYKRDRVVLPPAPEGTPRLMKTFGLFACGQAAL
ncbi:MAG: hypothetical protein JSW71_06445, partial [Gemmatimonadota bacterium]